MSVKEKSAPKEFMVVRGDRPDGFVMMLLIVDWISKKKLAVQVLTCVHVEINLVLPSFLLGWYSRDPFSDIWMSKEVFKNRASTFPIKNVVTVLILKTLRTSFLIHFLTSNFSGSFLREFTRTSNKPNTMQ
jgi:hypothetical protein